MATCVTPKFNDFLASLDENGAASGLLRWSDQRFETRA
jgi:hypothetical protein